MVDLKHQIGRDNPSESGVQMRPREKQKTAYEIGVRLVGSEMCIRDSDMNYKYWPDNVPGQW